MPTQPKGEVLNNSLILIGLVASKAGVGVMDNKIGAKEIDTRTEINTKAQIHPGRQQVIKVVLLQCRPFVQPCKTIKADLGFHL